MKRETSYPERLVPSLWNLQWKTEVHSHNTCGTCPSSPGKKPRASTSCPLRRAMLCHCGLVAAAVSTSLLMSIGSAVSLLPDDGHNATVLCFWPQNKAAPSRSPIPGPSAIILMQTPGCVNPLASAHSGAEGGEVMAATSGNTCSSSDEPDELCQGPFEVTLGEFGTAPEEVL